LAFVNINNQSLRKEVGFGGVWLMGSKGSSKQAGQSLIYFEWIVGWIETKHFKRKCLQRFVQIIIFPIFFFWNLFFEMPPGDSKSRGPLDFSEVTNDAPLKWVTFSPKGRPPGEEFSLPGDAERVESESPGKEPRVGDNN